MELHRGQILEGTQQRLKAQTHLCAQDAAAALAAASFLDQLTSSQVRLLNRCLHHDALSTAHVPQYEQALSTTKINYHEHICNATIYAAATAALLAPAC